MDPTVFMTVNHCQFIQITTLLYYRLGPTDCKPFQFLDACTSNVELTISNEFTNQQITNPKLQTLHKVLHE